MGYRQVGIGGDRLGGGGGQVWSWERRWRKQEVEVEDDGYGG